MVIKNDWYDLELPDTNWLVDGLISSDGTAGFCGKPKAGKSSAARDLTVAVIKGGDFLGRTVHTIEPGRVLFIHLDRKDIPARVGYEFKQMGITREETKRLILATAKHLPESFPERLAWLQEEVKALQPHLIVIDLLMYFVVTKSVNDYRDAIEGINKLLDALTAIEFKGALVVTQHSRKADNPNDSFDNGLGSTAQRGSLATNIMFERHRDQGIYTIETEQTVRDERYGEIDKSIIERDATGKMLLKSLYSDLKRAEWKTTNENDVIRVVDFISDNQDCMQSDITAALGMSIKTLGPLLKRVVADGSITMNGTGHKGDALRYSKYKMPVLKREVSIVQ